jgi:hypothetical protein
MLKTIIFPLSLLMLSGVWAATPADPDADLRAKKPVHEAKLTAIESQRLGFQRDLAKREETCLARFYSAGCMEDIRAEYLKTMRDFDLAREAELQALRDIDAEIRSRSRARRAEANLKGKGG